MIENVKHWAASQSVELFAAVSGALMHVMFAWANPLVMARQFVICVLAAYWLGPVVADIVTASTTLGGERLYGACIAITGLGGVYTLEIVVQFWRMVRDNPQKLLALLPWRKP